MPPFLICALRARWIASSPQASEATPFFGTAMPRNEDYAGFTEYVGLATVNSPTRTDCDVKPCFSFQSCT